MPSDDPPVPADTGDAPATEQTAIAPAADASGAASISFNAAQTGDSEPWYTAVEGASACAANTSPAQAIDRLQASGAIPTSLDTTAADGTLSAVVVSWSDEHGARSATYYRKLGDCQLDLPGEQTVPDQYK